MSDTANAEVGGRSEGVPSGLNVTPTDLAEHELGSPWMRPEFIDAIARRVVELGVGTDRGRSTIGKGLLTVSEVARRLNVSHGWVYAHKRDLGAIHLGRGPKARLRFELAAVLEELEKRNGSTGAGTGRSDRPSKRRRRRLVSRPVPRASRGS